MPRPWSSEGTGLGKRELYQAALEAKPAGAGKPAKPWRQREPAGSVQTGGA